MTAILYVYQAPASLLSNVKHMQARFQALLSVLFPSKAAASEVEALSMCWQLAPRQHVPACALLHAGGQAALVHVQALNPTNDGAQVSHAAYRCEEPWQHRFVCLPNSASFSAVTEATCCPAP